MSVLGTSRWHVGHQRFCWIRVWHSPWSWLKLNVAPASVAGNTLIGMLTRLILRYPFQVGRAGIGSNITIRRNGEDCYDARPFTSADPAGCLCGGSPLRRPDCRRAVLERDGRRRQRVPEQPYA